MTEYNSPATSFTIWNSGACVAVLFPPCFLLPSSSTHSVNMHARSVLPIVYIGTLRACQQISADASQSVWADSRSDRIGPPHVQSVWAECHVSSALANGFPY